MESIEYRIIIARAGTVLALPKTKYGGKVVIDGDKTFLTRVRLAEEPQYTCVYAEDFVEVVHDDNTIQRFRVSDTALGIDIIPLDADFVHALRNTWDVAKPFLRNSVSEILGGKSCPRHLPSETVRQFIDVKTMHDALPRVVRPKVVHYLSVMAEPHRAYYASRAFPDGQVWRFSV